MREFIDVEPCRFCREKPSLWTTRKKKKYVVWCDFCGAHTDRNDTVYDAVVDWNEGRVVKEGDDDEA